MKLHIDIETRSVVDLRKTGQYVYAEAPSTEITTVGWAIDNYPVRVWLPPTSTWSAGRLAELTLPDWLDVGEMPDMLAFALADPAVLKVAHNASFERTVLSGAAGQRAGFPSTLGSLAQWDCTAARAACYGLPRTLAGAAAALDLEVQKDADGHRLMLQMCKPRRPRKTEDQAGTYWFDDADRVVRQALYCKHDVEAEQAVDAALPTLAPEERECWEITERMNDDGVLVDDKLLVAVSNMIEVAEDRLSKSLYEKTGGMAKSLSHHVGLRRWLMSQGIDDAEENGVDKAAVAAMIARDDLPTTVREVLLVRQDGGGSSAKKWKALLTRLSGDNRTRGELVYCGAAMTRRWSSRGVQLQNLPARISITGSVDHAVRDLLDGATIDEVEELYGPSLLVASALLRPAFIAPRGAVLARGDLSQIEARVNPWMAGATWKLDAFRALDAGTGPDLYKVGASGIYGKPHTDITKEERQVGKVSELALGFAGGAHALQKMARNYGVKIPEWPRDERGWAVKPHENPQLQFDGTDEWIKRKWRAANPEIVGMWKGLEAASMECMGRPPGDTVPVQVLDSDGDVMHPARLSFRRNAKVLVLMLPSGRGLAYWTPRLRKRSTPFGERWSLSYRAENSIKKRWQEFDAYGGLFCQGATQATARDVMRDALRRFPAMGIRPVLTVHDEGIGEVSGMSAADAAALVNKAMTTPPAWAVGLPIAADSSAGPRYIKG